MMRLRVFGKLFLIFAIVIMGELFCGQGQASVTLNNTELFIRCYTQITQRRIDFSHPLLAQVKAGTKDPIVACLEVFDKARFNSSNTISNVNDVDAKLVLKTMHRFHTTFFTYKDIPRIGGEANEITRDVFDPEASAYYFTRALFKPDTDFKTITTLNSHVRSIRTDNDPALGPATNKPKSDSIFVNGYTNAAKGDLLGVETVGSTPTHYEYLDVNGVTQSGSIDLTQHFGGGIVGSSPYLLAVMTRENSFRPNGLKMLRGLGKVMFSDLLCRELPVVRYADVAVFKDNASDIPFRQTQGCVQCHASMDRIAASARGLTFSNMGRPTGAVNPKYGPQFVTSLAPTLGDGTAWPIHTDSSYFKRESDGVFFFRNSNGDLVNSPFRGLAALGNILAAQPDLYLCAAKRYYSYFMGVSVQIEDPQKVGYLSPTDSIHLQNVKNLAAKLQQTQRLRDVVSGILNLPEYKKSSFGADR